MHQHLFTQIIKWICFQILETIGEDMGSQRILYSPEDRYWEFKSQYESVFDQAGEENYFTFFNISQ